MIDLKVCQRHLLNLQLPYFAQESFGLTKSPLNFWLFIAFETLIIEGQSGWPSSCTTANIKSAVIFSSLEKMSLNNATETDLVFNVTRRTMQLRVLPTDLRRNRLYYQVYCIGLNTLIGTFLPLLSLLYLNIRTVMELRTMMKQEEAGLTSTSDKDNNHQPHHRNRVTKLKKYFRRSKKNQNHNLDKVSIEEETENLSDFRRLKDEATRRPTTLELNQDPGSRSNSMVVARLQRSQMQRAEEAAQRKRESRLTRISLCIVWLFIFCYSWKLIPTVYEGLNYGKSDAKVLGKWPHWLSLVNDISHTLIVFNSAVNFLIYATLWIIVTLQINSTVKSRFNEWPR